MYYKCLNVNWYKWDFDSSSYVVYRYIAFSSGGLTKEMANALNPLEKTDYENAEGTTVYVVNYKHMKVCSCVYACGLNGFKYAMLWNR